MKILVVLPFYGGSLPIARYVAKALEDLGHIVSVFEAPSFFPAFSALDGLGLAKAKKDQLEINFINLTSQAILAKAEVFEPNLVLSLAQAPLSRLALRKFKRDNVATAMYFVEDYNIFKYWRSFAPEYDYFFIIQKGEFEERLKEIGANGFYLPLAALPSFHKKLDLSPEEKRKFGSDISFLGAGYPNRRLAFRAFTALNFKIWGSDWDGETVLAKNIQNAGERVEAQDAVKIFNATKVNLNLHSSVQAKNLVSHGDFVNPRTFELAACKAFQLIDNRSLLPELFESDELATFNTIDEMRDKIHYYLNNEDKRFEMAEKAHKKVIEKHTYQVRMQEMLNIIKETRPDIFEQKANSGYEMLGDMKDDVKALLEELELPSSTSFDDLIIALRKKSGILKPLESSLLFLDEWRKQYSK